MLQAFCCSIAICMANIHTCFILLFLQLKPSQPGTVRRNTRRPISVPYVSFIKRKFHSDSSQDMLVEQTTEDFPIPTILSSSCQGSSFIYVLIICIILCQSERSLIDSNSQWEIGEPRWVRYIHSYANVGGKRYVRISYYIPCMIKTVVSGRIIVIAEKFVNVLELPCQLRCSQI